MSPRDDKHVHIAVERGFLFSNGSFGYHDTISETLIEIALKVNFDIVCVRVCSQWVICVVTIVCK